MILCFVLGILSFVFAGGFLLNNDPCSKCGEPIDVTLEAINEFRDPHFTISVKLEATYQRELILLLQEAAENDGHFNFTVSYHKSLGFMVQAINNTKTNFAEDGAFWQIFEYNPSVSVGSRHICYGVSTHRPNNGDIITFLFSNTTVSLAHCPDVVPTQ
ncbi:uncharacterized protein LOC112564394 [Pomacea canaliculata]|uniref:uncharacterized protein LOC112564394 n=1 Tax=Pomacea canaliculata TaxID=400727 RepID=UPI000D7295CD|nr:uncharacterized protein LOC112564394 [Pomacea canaliculata]